MSTHFAKQTFAHTGDEAGLQCPECGGKVFKTMQGGASTYYGGTYWRRKKCSGCGTLFQTYETFDYMLKESTK